MNRKLVLIKNLKFSYPRSDFTLQVPELEIAEQSRVVLIGKSGCGKTTLAHLVAGILKANSGVISVGGLELSRLNESSRRAFRVSQIGFIFQEFELLDYLSVTDNLLLPFSINKSLNLSTGTREHALSIADSVGLSKKMTSFPSELSGGERQRLAIARALVTRPGLVIADEPTGNLDSETASTVMGELLKHVTEAGASLITITHDKSLLSLFDRSVDVSNFSQ